MFQSVGVTFDSTKWDELLKCKDGKLPLKICALPDGTMVPPLVPILTVENTGGVGAGLLLACDLHRIMASEQSLVHDDGGHKVLRHAA